MSGKLKLLRFTHNFKDCVTQIYKVVSANSTMISKAISELAQQQGIPLWLLVFIILWSLVWKALAWWKSARLGQPIWFIAFFIVNTLGILEILYLFLFSKEEFLASFRKHRDKPTKVTKQRESRR